MVGRPRERLREFHFATCVATFRQRVEDTKVTIAPCDSNQGMRSATKPQAVSSVTPTQEPRGHSPNGTSGRVLLARVE